MTSAENTDSIRFFGARTERDSFGAIEVDADRYWGAQTQRSLQNFDIGGERMPIEIIHALALVKKTAAEINREAGKLDSPRAAAIISAAQEIIDGRFDEHFPLVVWQTGSGTQTNMNVNEVIANRANELMGAQLGSNAPVHPNDHVNLGQSSNDCFPTAMHLAIVRQTLIRLLPRLAALREEIDGKARAFAEIVKIGRTHLQDATPLTLGQEFSGYAAQISSALERIANALQPLFALAQGGTAVGSGLNSWPGFDLAFANRIAAVTGQPFRPAGNKFEAIAAHDSIVYFHGALEALAAGLFKIANDIRLLGSGPRAGLGELRLPENEPGSSIMPGKVNPTQTEALTMVCARVAGNQATIAFAASQGHLELNAFKPVIAYAALQSLRLLGDAAESFRRHCVAGIEPDRRRIAELVERSLMLVTALAPKIGYDNAAAIAKRAHAEGLSLRQAALDSGLVSAEEFDAIVRPERMVAPM